MPELAGHEAAILDGRSRTGRSSAPPARTASPPNASSRAALVTSSRSCRSAPASRA